MDATALGYRVTVDRSGNVATWPGFGVYRVDLTKSQIVDPVSSLAPPKHRASGDSGGVLSALPAAGNTATETGERPVAGPGAANPSGGSEPDLLPGDGESHDEQGDRQIAIVAGDLAPSAVLVTAPSPSPEIVVAFVVAELTRPEPPMNVLQPLPLCRWPGCDRPEVTGRFCKRDDSRARTLHNTAALDDARMVDLPRAWAAHVAANEEKRKHALVNRNREARTPVKHTSEVTNADTPAPVSRRGPEPSGGIFDTMLRKALGLPIDVSNALVMAHVDNVVQAAANHTEIREKLMMLPSWTHAEVLAGILASQRSNLAILNKRNNLAGDLKTMTEQYEDSCDMIGRICKVLDCEGSADTLVEQVQEIKGERERLSLALDEANTRLTTWAAKFQLPSHNPTQTLSLTEADLERRFAALTESRKLRAIALGEVSDVSGS